MLYFLVLHLLFLLNFPIKFVELMRAAVLRIVPLRSIRIIRGFLVRIVITSVVSVFLLPAVFPLLPCQIHLCVLSLLPLSVLRRLTALALLDYSCLAAAPGRLCLDVPAELNFSLFLVIVVLIILIIFIAVFSASLIALVLVEARFVIVAAGVILSRLLALLLILSRISPFGL